MSSVNPTSKTNTLEGVNRVLLELGESPVAAIPVAGDQRMADLESMLDAVTKETLLEGWEFNTQYDLAVTVSGGALTLPAGILEMRPMDGTLDLVQRANAMFDRKTNSATFVNGTVYLMWAIRGLPFNEIPERVQNLIIIDTALRYLRSFDPQSELLEILGERRARARAEAQRHEHLTEGGRRSMLNTPGAYQVLYMGRRGGYGSSTEWGY